MTLPRFGKKPEPPTPGRPAPAAVFGRDVGQAAVLVMTHTPNMMANPPLTIRSAIKLDGQWSINEYWRAEQLEGNHLTPVERGHVYTAVFSAGVGAWLVSGLRALDEEGACLLDGLSASSANEVVRTRWKVKERIPQYMGSGFFLDERDLLTFKTRVEDAGGLLRVHGPLLNQAAMGARAIMTEVDSLTLRALEASHRLPLEAASITEATWSSEANRITDEVDAILREKDRLSKVIPEWTTALNRSPHPSKPDVMMAKALIDQATTKMQNLSATDRAVAALRRRLRDIAAGEPIVSASLVRYALDAAVQNVWWVGQLAGLMTVHDSTSDEPKRVRLEARGTGAALTMLLRKGQMPTVEVSAELLDALVNVEVERRATAGRADATAGGRFDLD